MVEIPVGGVATFVEPKLLREGRPKESEAAILIRESRHR